jgi:hypothetical protein
VHSIELVGAPDWFKDGPVALLYGITAVLLTCAPAIKDASELCCVNYWLQAKMKGTAAAGLPQQGGSAFTPGR